MDNMNMNIYINTETFEFPKFNILIENLSNLVINENEYLMTNENEINVFLQNRLNFSLENIIKYFKYLIILEQTNKQLLNEKEEILNEYLYDTLRNEEITYEEIKYFIDFFIEKLKLISNNVFKVFTKVSNMSNIDIEFIVVDYFIKKSLENNLRDKLIINLKNFILEEMSEWIYEDDDILLKYMDIFYSIDRTILLDINNEILKIFEDISPKRFTILIDYFYKYNDLLNSKPIVNNILKNIIDKIFICQNPFFLEAYLLSSSNNLYSKFEINILEELKNKLSIQDLNKYNNYFKYSIMNHYTNIDNIIEIGLLENLKMTNKSYPFRRLKEIINKNFDLKDIIFYKYNNTHIQFGSKYYDYVITLKDLQ